MRPLANRCGAPGKNGPCRAWAATGSDRCPLHGENAVQEIASRHQAHREARAQGAQEAAQQARRGGLASRLKLDTPKQIHAFVEETAQRLRAGLIPAATAVALDRLARTALAAVDSRLLEEAQAEIQSSKANSPTSVRRR